MAHRVIDQATWPRREHFRLFRAVDFPYFSVTTDVDVTAWRRAQVASGAPLFASLVHAVTAAANRVEALRTRIRGEEVVLHDRIHPSFTVPWRGDLFNFCTVPFDPDLAVFLPRCAEAIAASSASETLVLDHADQDDQIYLSCLPWFGFTSVTHAVDARKHDSFPRITWGRLDEHGGRSSLPMNFQLHHGLADGRHVALFLEAFHAGAGSI